MVVKIQKGKGTKKCVIKEKIKFENYKNCLEATQIDNKKKFSRKNQIDIDGIDKNHKNSWKTK